jgi:hypothetical protein
MKVIISIRFISYRENTIRLYICLVVNSMREEFILIYTYIYIRVTTKNLSGLYL